MLFLINSFILMIKFYQFAKIITSGISCSPNVNDLLSFIIQDTLFSSALEKKEKKGKEYFNSPYCVQTPGRGICKCSVTQD